MNKDYLSVSEINKIVKYTIDESLELRSVYLKGEISNFKYHGRGHLYFSLKDENSKINAVMFSYEASNLSFMPKDGDSVLVHGRISVYEATGNYQIYVDNMSLDGVGDLYVLFEQLKKKLDNEGLFSQNHKRKICKNPKKIGVITAPTGAAVRDIITTINRRYPLVEIYVFPTLVQGNLASKNIVKMIELANTMDLDTLIVGRGGGSIEDLWAFNEEIVARSIYNSKIPIITGIGHEIDFTISDFVSDLRAPTPTGAAELSVPDINEIKLYLHNCKDRINSVLDNKIYTYKQIIKKYKDNYLLNNPKRLYEVKEQQLDIIYDKLSNLLMNLIQKKSYLIDKYKTKLNLLNPISVLDKGYSIVYKNNKIVNNVLKLKEDDELKIMFKNGNIISKVKEVNCNEWKNF